MHRAQMRVEAAQAASQESEFSAPAHEPAPERPMVAAYEPAPVVAYEPTPVVAYEPAPVPVVATPAPAVTEVRAALESSGLQMVETKSDRAAAPAPEPAEPLGRPRAERPRHRAEDEPLVQVETKN